MKLKDYLKDQGLFIKDIILKCKNNQITLNGEKCSESDEIFIGKVIDYSEFITLLLKRFPESHGILTYSKIEDLHSSNINSKLVKFINLHTIIKTTKSTGLVLRNEDFYDVAETFAKQIILCRTAEYIYHY